jgi:sugar phosphate permease
MKASRVRYGVVGFALSLAVLAYIQRVAISQAALPIQEDLGLTKMQMGAIFGAFALSYALFEIPMGALGDKLGVRRILTQIVLLWSAFTALTGAAWSMTSMWVIRFLFGAGEAGCFPNLTKMLSVWLPQNERMTAQSLMWACTRWGGAITPPLALLAITAFGWRWGFVLFGLLGVFWVAVFLKFFKDDPADHKGVNPEELKLLEGSRNLAADHGGGWAKVLFKPEVLVLLVQYFCFSFVWYFYVTWLPTYLKETWGLTQAQVAGYAVLPLLFGGFGSLLSGLLPMRVPRRWLAFGGIAATALLLYAVTQAQSVMMAMAAMAMASFCSDLAMPVSWNTCVELGRRYTATVAAAMNMFGNFAGFVAPVVSPFILQQSGGDWNGVIYVMIGSATIAALCWLYLDPEKIARRHAAAAPLVGGTASSAGTP